MIQECITTEKAPKAIGPYSPAIKLGDMIFTSGQLPIVPETGELISDSIEDQTEQCLRNIEAILEEAGISMKYVLKTTVYMTNLGEFGKMNDVYARFFKEPYPARSAAQVSALAKGARIEIECMALDSRALEVICSQDGCSSCETACGREE